MRHIVSIREEIGNEIEDVAEEEGISISEFYARAAEAHLQRIRRRRAIQELDRRAGTIDTHGNVNEALKEIRKEGPERSDERELGPITRRIAGAFDSPSPSEEDSPSTSPLHDETSGADR